MISTAITAGFLVTLGMVLLAMKFGNNFIKRLLGYDWAVDICITLGCMWLFAIGGTISGMMTGIVTGVLISLLLLVGKHVIGYRKIVRNENGQLEWQEFQPDWQDKVREIFGDATFVSPTSRP
jgi:hypothetical protein